MTAPAIKEVHGWTIATYAAHNEAMRLADDKLRAADERFFSERDRRYAEVKAAEEKALRVKEEADRTALGLQRENQQYKDEKANQLREQIGSERGLYASKTDLVAAMDKIGATLTPVVQYVSTQQGGSKGMRDLWGWVIAAVLAGAELYRLFAPHAG